MTGQQRAARTGGRRDTVRQRLWDAMRVEGNFSRDDLLRLAVEGAATQGNERSAREFLTALYRAGYLRLLRQGKGTANGGNGGGVQSRYRLHRDTGPIAPRYGKKTRLVYDPNTGEEIDLAKEASDA